MNNQRRKLIDKIKSELEGLKATLDELKDQIDLIKDEEQEAFDGCPESLQQGERGQVMVEAVNNLEQAIDYTDEAVIALYNALTSLEDAQA